MKKAGVTISNVVTGPCIDADKPFQYMVFIYNGNNIATGTSFSYVGGVVDGSGATAPPNGSFLMTGNGGYLSLKHGQTATFELATTYQVKVAQVKYDSYDTSIYGTTGADVTLAIPNPPSGTVNHPGYASPPKPIPADGLAFAFTNARKVADVTVSKTVAGAGGNKNIDFPFTIQIKDGETPLGNGIQFAYEGSAIGGVTAPENDKLNLEGGAATINLKHGQTITIKNVPINFSVSVTESGGPAGYETKISHGGDFIEGKGTGIKQVVAGGLTFGFRNTYAVPPPA
jgi:hypothetical protein